MEYLDKDEYRFPISGLIDGIKICGDIVQDVNTGQLIVEISHETLFTPTAAFHALQQSDCYRQTSFGYNEWCE